MQLQTAGQVSKAFGISTRMLRYYEQVGLLEGLRKDDYAYRVYDEENIKRLQQIIILRKLQIPIKQIAVILNSPDAATATEIFNENIKTLQNEIAAMETIKAALELFVAQIEELAAVRLNLNLLTDDTVMQLAQQLPLTQKNVKEYHTMNDVNQANEVLGSLKDKDVRIVYLPPATVLSHHAVGDDEQGRIPEDQSEPLLDNFEKELAAIKPDFRHYGFNHDVRDKHGYERWVTIPDDMEVAAPFTKKLFPGGMYAACVLPVDPWEEGWGLLEQWIAQNDKYEVDDRGWLEEHTTAAAIITGAEMYIDLLLPVKKRTKKREPIKLGYIENSEKLCGYKASVIKKGGFTVAGYTTFQFDAPQEKFYEELIADGRLAQLTAQLKPGAPVLIYQSYDYECVQMKAKTGNGCFRQTICADVNDILDLDALGDVFTEKTAPKHWIEFEFPRKQLKKFAKNSGPHGHVQKLGWRFSGSGHFHVCLDREIMLTKENKKTVLKFWMPVVPKG
ncbi:MAG: effector binding domain-containing protein [Oscillospiraceae bacterium]|nr:effector binding domain-containing protein [Oscillospiraceae bacterium]